jgi:predicted nucleic acid-binding protein
MRAVLADTGPLYASIDPDDSHHERARREIKRLAQERRGVMVAYPTVLESHRLVLQRLGRKSASSWLDEVLKTGALANPSEQDYLEGVMMLSSLPDQSITLFDATLAALASRLKMEVWTYDHHFDAMRVKVWR